MTGMRPVQRIRAFFGTMAGQIFLILTLGMSVAAIIALLVAEQARHHDFERVRRARVVASAVDIADRLQRDPARVEAMMANHRIVGAAMARHRGNVQRTRPRTQTMAIATGIVASSLVMDRWNEMSRRLAATIYMRDTALLPTHFTMGCSWFTWTSTNWTRFLPTAGFGRPVAPISPGFAEPTISAIPISRLMSACVNSYWNAPPWWLTAPFACSLTCVILVTFSIQSACSTVLTRWTLASLPWSPRSTTHRGEKLIAT